MLQPETSRAAPATHVAACVGAAVWRMRAALPRPSALKFVVMLRRPEERAASHFRMLGKLARRGEEWAQAGTPCPGPPHPALHAPRPSQSTSTPPPLLWLRPTANPNLHQVYVANHSLDSKLRAEATAFAACARAYAAAAQSRGEGDGGVGGMPAQARPAASSTPSLRTLRPIPPLLLRAGVARVCRRGVRLPLLRGRAVALRSAAAWLAGQARPHVLVHPTRRRRARRLPPLLSRGSFSTRQFLALTLDEFAAAPRAVLPRVASFLGVVPFPRLVLNWNWQWNQLKQNPGAQAAAGAAPSPLLAELRAFYAPYNAGLAALLRKRGQAHTARYVEGWRENASAVDGAL